MRSLLELFVEIFRGKILYALVGLDTVGQASCLVGAGVAKRGHISWYP